MIPRTYPSVVSDDGQTVMRVHVLQSIAGLTEWVDYIPVKFVDDSTGGNTSDTTGSMFVENTGNPSTMQSWVDYIPVWIDSTGTMPYTTNNDGYIPVYDYTGLLSLFSQGQEGVWYDVADPNLGWRRNQLTWTEQFDNSAYTKGNTTVTANAGVAPDGTSTADLIYPSSTGSLRQVYSANQTLTGTHTLSVYVKSAGFQWVCLMFTAGVANITTGAFFDVVNGVVGTNGSGTGSAYNETITDIGSGWFRISVTIDSTALSRRFSLGLSDADNSFDATTSGTSGIYIWGAQLEQASTASTYQRITNGGTADFTALTGTIPTLYQDYQGVTPCSTPGQGVAMPVGLMLDKHKGLVLGDELVTNGDFSDPVTTGWTPTGGTLSVVDGQLRLTSSSSPAFAGYSFTTVVGKTYRISGDWSSNAGTWRIIVGTTSGGSNLYTPSGAVSGTVDAVFTATATTTYISVRSVVITVGDFVEIDNISVKEVPGNHAYQSTSASRPALSGRYNALTFTEQFDNAAWTKPVAGTGVAAVVTPNYGTAPDGTTTACRVQLNKGAGTTISDYSGLQNTLGTTISGQATGSVYIKTADATTKTVCLRLLAGTETFVVNGNWQKISASEVNGTFWQLILRGTYGTSDSADLLIWHPDFRVANDGIALPEYQRVVDALTYDTTGFPLYLSCDGVDDGMATNSIDFSALNPNAVLGSELVTNGTFDSASDWSLVSGAAISGGALVFDGTEAEASGTPLASQTVATSFVSGKFYEVSFQITTALTGSVSISPSGTTGTPHAAAGTYREILLSASTTTSLQIIKRGATTVSGAIDNISVKEIDAADVPDKMFVAAGVRKLSDAAIGVIAEFSATAASNAGSWYVSAPDIAAANYGIRSGGNVRPASSLMTTFTAPISNVVTLVNDISGDSRIGRVNGVQSVNTTDDQGTGTYGNYPLYLFRRGGTTLPFTGRFYSLVVRGGALPSDAQIAQVEKYAGTKVGFQAPTIDGLPTLEVNGVSV